jgi:hypothetical protein
MIFSYPYWLQLIGMGCSSIIGGPDQPEPDWRGAGGEAETLAYLNDIIRELKQLADKGGYRTLSAILGAALVEAHIQSGESEH